MKAKKFIIIAIVYTLNSFYCSAQIRDLSNVEIGRHINICINVNYHPDSSSLAKTCKRSCIFIKFKVANSGRISNLSFSKDSSVFVTAGLTKAVLLLEKDKSLMYTLKRLKITIIQPIIYDYQLGCRFSVNDRNQTEENAKKSISSYYKIRDDMEHYGESIFEMMNFSDVKLTAITCILLQPIRFGAGFVE